MRFAGIEYEWNFCHGKSQTSWQSKFHVTCQDEKRITAKQNDLVQIETTTLDFPKVVLRLVNTWKALHAKESDRNFKAQSYSTVLTDDNELFAFNAVAETKKMEYLVKAFSWTLETRKWKDLCSFFAEHDERDCASYLRVLECIELNRLDPGTREYKMLWRVRQQWARSIMRSGARRIILSMLSVVPERRQRNRCFRRAWPERR